MTTKLLGGGLPCWFKQATTLDANGDVELAVYTDIAVNGTDVTLSADPTKVEVQTAGIYDVLISISASGPADGALNVYPVVNDDSIGPAYDLNPLLATAGGHVARDVTFPIVLAVGDTVGVHGFAFTGAGTEIDKVRLALTRRA